MSRIAKEILSITLLSIVMGFIRYGLIDEKFPLAKQKRSLNTIPSNQNNSDECYIPEDFSEPLLIDLQFSKCLFDDKKAVFIDSRDQEEYRVRHIKDAINIPYDNLELFEYQLDDIDFETPLVVYCSGGECSLSIDLADYLFFDRGYFNILVFEGGMPEWQESGFPMQ